MSKEKCPNCNGVGKSSVRSVKELVNYLITEIIRHVQCVVELQMRLVPRALAQVELPLPLALGVQLLNDLRRNTLLSIN